MARIDNRGNLRGSASAAGGVEVRGGNDFYALARHLKNAGQTDLRKQFLSASKLAAAPLVPLVREAARSSLPKHGGLNERIAKKPYRTATRTGARTAGVRITGAKVDPRINNEGRVYHPVFGRKPGVVQQVPAAKGYFDQTLEHAGPEVQKALLDLMQQWTRDLLLRGL